MKSSASSPAAIDEYIASFPPEVRARLSRVRAPHDEPLPLGLIADIVKFRVAESTGPEAKRPRHGKAKRETRKS